MEQTWRHERSGRAAEDGRPLRPSNADGRSRDPPWRRGPRPLRRIVRGPYGERHNRAAAGGGASPRPRGGVYTRPPPRTPLGPAPHPPVSLRRLEPHLPPPDRLLGGGAAAAAPRPAAPACPRHAP